MGKDMLRISQLPERTHYGHLGWAARKLPMGSEIHAISYHPRDLYVMATGQPEEYTLPDDTYHYDWSREGMY
jgi:cleavage and polyadenylation specificity factor subunit 1